MASCLALCAEFSNEAGPIDDLADCAKRIQTINLYCCVQRFIGTRNPAQMQRFFEPISVTYQKDEGLKHSKKYRNYARGDSLPNAETMRIMIEVTNQDWHFEKFRVLWSVLDLTVSPQPMEILLHYLAGMQEQQLALELYECVVARRTKMISVLCVKLLMLPGMPALTALIVLLRIAHDSGEHKAASILANYLALKLMFMGSELQQRGIANLFFRLAVHHLFPLAEEWKVDITPLGLARRSMMLNLLPFCSRGVTAITKIGQRMREEIMFLWQLEAHGRMFTEALSLKVVKGGHRAEPLSIQDDWRRQATKQFIDLIDQVQHRSPLILAPDYLDPDVDFRLIGKHRWAEFRSHLDQLANG